LISIVACFTTVFGVTAQEPFQLGIKSGFVAAQHWSPNEKPEGTTVNPGTDTGFSAGDLFKYMFNKKFAFFVEANYFPKGAHHVVTAPEFPYGEMLLTYRYN